MTAKQQRVVVDPLKEIEILLTMHFLHSKLTKAGMKKMLRKIEKIVDKMPDGPVQYKH